VPLDGLTLRGSWGTSFRAPSFSDASALSGVQIQPLNASTGDANNIAACLPGETAPPAGSAAAALGATCAAIAALPGSQTVNGSIFPGGIVVRGGAGGAQLIRGGQALGPEEADNWSIGFQYAPTANFLAGLNIDVTYFHIKIDGLIQGIDPSNVTLRDPNVRFTVIGRDDPNFATWSAQLIRDPRTQVSTDVEANIHYIVDSAVRNVGYVMTDGFDFSVGYEFDLGNWGTPNVGIDGTYFLHRETLNIPGTDPVQAYEGDSLACLYCAPPIPPRFRYRARLGWSSADAAWNVNLFANYTTHHFHQQVRPPNAPPNYSNIVPAHVTVDMSIGYNTGTDAVNDYLDNLDIRLVVNNVMNKYPPFMYKVSSGGSNPAAFDISQSPVGRQATIVLTKTW
jgi:iron complex outermembrane receptor protein